MQPRPPEGENGIIIVVSPYSVPETANRIVEVAQGSGLTLFARINFAKDAERVGLRMPRAELLILANPRAGTPLMVASPTIAIDLPLKVPVWQDAQGHVHVSYNAPEYLQRRHRVPNAPIKNISGIAALVDRALT